MRHARRGGTTILEIATVIIDMDSDSLRIRRSRNPWIDPPIVTRAMEIIARELINNYTETLNFIEEIEGPTTEEAVTHEVEYLEMIGILF